MATFKIIGSNIMTLINQIVDEGRLKTAIDIIDSCGVPKDFILDVVLRKSLIAGDSGEDSLHLEDNEENVEKWKKNWLEKLCKSYAKKIVKSSVLQDKIYYYTLLIDSRGIFYRTKSTDETYSSRNLDIKTLNKLTSEIEDLNPLITDILPYLSLPVSYIDEYIQKEYLEVEEELEKIHSLVEDKGFLPNVNSNNVPYQEVSKTGSLEDYIKIEKVKEKAKLKINPFGLDIDCINTAWIAPNGFFYGKFGAIYEFVHIEIANSLIESEIIPESDNPDEWLEKNGWLKLSQGRLLAFHSENEITKNQIETLKKYSEIRKLDKIVIGMLGKTFPVKNLDNLSIEHLIRA